MGDENKDRKIKVIDTNKAGWQSVNKDYQKEWNAQYTDDKVAEKRFDRKLRKDAWNWGGG